MRKYFLHLILFCFVLFSNIHAVGSWSTPSRLGHQTIQTSGNGTSSNNIEGYTFLDDAFELESATTTCTWDAFYPVRGPISLNGGTVYLQQDFKMGGTSSMESSGSIYCYGKQFDFGSTTTSFDVSGASGSLTEQVSLDDASNPVVNGENPSIQYGYSCDWSYDGAYCIVGGKSYIYDWRIYSFDGSSLTHVDGIDNNDVAYNLRAHPSEYYVAVTRNYTKQVYVHKYTGVGITDNISESFDESPRAVAWHPSGNYLAVGIYGEGDKGIGIYEFGTSPMSLTYVCSCDVDTASQFYGALDWSPDIGGNYYLVAGTHGGYQELSVYQFDPVGETLTRKVYEDDTAVADVAWDPNGDYIMTGSSKDSGDNLVMYRFTPPNTLDFVWDAAVPKYIYSTQWSSDGLKVAAGFSKHGEETELRIYSCNRSTGELTEDSGSVHHDAGDFEGVRSVKWRNDDEYLAVVEYKSGLLSIYKTFETVAGAFAPLLFEDANIVLNSDLGITGTLELRGTCTLVGNGHRMDLATTGSLVISRNANVTLQNIKIENVDTTNGFETWDGSTVYMDGVIMKLSGNYSYTTGTWNVTKRGLNIEGDGNTFEHASSQPLTVDTNSSLGMKRGTTFSYNSSGATNLAINGEFLFDQSTLSLAAGKSLTLNSGTLVAKNMVQMNGGSLIGTPLILGDGLDLYIEGGSLINLTSGFVQYGS